MNITAVAIVAIICWAIVELTGNKSKKQSAKKDQDYEELQNTVNQLQERVATLEKIVTDEKYDLKREIESLKTN